MYIYINISFIFYIQLLLTGALQLYVGAQRPFFTSAQQPYFDAQQPFFIGAQQPYIDAQQPLFTGTQQPYVGVQQLPRTNLKKLTKSFTFRALRHSSPLNLK